MSAGSLPVRSFGQLSRPPVPCLHESYGVPVAPSQMDIDYMKAANQSRSFGFPPQQFGYVPGPQVLPPPPSTSSN